MSSLGVIPGSTVEDPCGAGTDQFSSSLLKNRLAACACASHMAVETEGYSG